MTSNYNKTEWKQYKKEQRKKTEYEKLVRRDNIIEGSLLISYIILSCGF